MTEPNSSPMQEAGPGAMLRRAREERRLSIEDVAQELRLAPRTVEALEADAYDRLPGPTYVRGYLRNYAQFLELPPQRVIDVYNARPEAAAPVQLGTRPAPARQATSSDALVRLGTVVVAVAVFGLAALWWSGHELSAPPPVQPSATDDDAEPASAPAATEAPEAPPAPTVAIVPEESETPAPSPARAEAPPASTPPVSAPAEPETGSAPPASEPAVPTSRLVLRMHEDSWADVRDARQRRLLYETVPAGSVVTVEGVPPISVFLGNVAGVDVEFEGKPYDAMRHRRGDVARFTLGRPQG
ncbi:MAG TPA: RodZ domain-containing protein [Burkholderiales bacterium]